MRTPYNMGWTKIPILMAVGLYLVIPTTQAFVCPNVTEVSPCDCYLGPSSYPYLDCIGPDVTQGVLNRVLAAIRRENNQTLNMDHFRLKFTTITELDLTPFEGGFFSQMDFNNNSLLSRVVGPALNSTNWDLITPHRLYWEYNNFQDEGLQTMLSYFNATSRIFPLYYLSLRGNKLTGTLGQEFLPGISGWSQAFNLDLSHNNIRALGGGQFRGMRDVYVIEVSNNRLEEIGEDAFVTADDPHYENMEVYLNDNHLTDESIHLSSGASNANRKFSLYLHYNQFQRVREGRFLNFLEVHPQNILVFDGNPIWCGPEMKWLKDRRQEFETRVRGLNCTNDPGETAFTSSLVDG